MNATAEFRKNAKRSRRRALFLTLLLHAVVVIGGFYASGEGMEALLETLQSYFIEEKTNIPVS